MKKSTKVLISAAVCGFVSISAHAADKGGKDSGSKGECHGVNSCKAQGACHGKDNSCKGTNTCKGKGWIPLSKEECEHAKGTFKPMAGQK